MFLPMTGTALRTDRTQLDYVDCGAKDSLLQDFGRHQLKCAKGSIYAATNLFQRTCSSKKCEYTRKNMKLSQLCCLVITSLSIV